MRIIFVSLLLMFFAVSCEKEALVVDGNRIPLHEAVSSLAVENFINKSYIDLVGRKPNESQYASAFKELERSAFSQASKQAFITSLQTSQEYFHWLYELVKDKFLNGESDQAIEGRIARYIRQQSMLPPTNPLYALLQLRIDQLIALDSSWVKLSSGAVDVSGFFKPLMMNEIYDEINMGAANFTIACFENLLNRLPTANEQSRGIAMVNGQPVFIMLQTGSSKEDLVDILTTSSEFFEGRIVDLYTQLLGREPSSAEIASALPLFLLNKNWSAVQLELMVDVEYAGF